MAAELTSDGMIQYTNHSGQTVMSKLTNMKIIVPPGGPDVALVYVPELKDAAVAKLAAENPKEGDRVFLSGFPGNISEKAVSVGTVKAISDTEVTTTNESRMGNSGSPLFDGAGNVVGLHWGSIMSIFTMTSSQVSVPAIREFLKGHDLTAPPP